MAGGGASRDPGAQERLCADRESRHAHPEAAHGVGDGVGDRSGGADRAPLAHALDAPGRHGRRRFQVPNLGRRHVVRLRQRVVHQRRREELAVVAVDDAFEQRLADPLGDGAVDLTLDDQRVDDGAAVLDEGVAPESDAPRLAIDLDDGDVHGAGERRPRRVEVHGGLEARGAPGGGAYARRVTSLSITARWGAPRTHARPSSSVTSEGLASRQWAASAWSFSLTRSAATAALPSIETAPRLPKVPLPRGATSVSTASTRTASMEMPRRSPTSCAIVVAWPWPCDGKLVTQLTVPSAPIVTVAASMPGTWTIPRRRNTAAPMPVYSV